MINVNGIDQPFDANTVLKLYLTGNKDVIVSSGIYAGKVFPRPAEALQVAKRYLHGKAPQIEEETVSWMYQNLASASYFDAIWDAFDLGKQSGLEQICSLCNYSPCWALDPCQDDILPPWRCVNSVKKTSVQQRYAIYSELAQGASRSIIPACHLLAIRLHFPGGKIVGYKPKAKEIIPEEGDNNKPQTKNQKPKTKNQKPKTKNQKPKTKNQKPKTKNQKPKNQKTKKQKIDETEY
jgi:hypothetical protein